MNNPSKETLSPILITFFWISITILTRSFSSICLKKAADVTGDGTLLEGLLNPWYAGALFSLIIQAGSWIMVLRVISLTKAYPFMSLVFIINIVAAQWIFHESIHTLHIVGIACILFGVVFSHRTEELDYGN